MEVNQNKVASLINAATAALNELSAHLGLEGTSAAPLFEPVFDVQPAGFYRLGAVERFRAELKANPDPLAQRYAAGLPEFWFVQDGDSYVTLTDEQDRLQDYNTSNARFTLKLFTGSNLWETFADAVRLIEDPATVDGSLKHERILVDGKPVGVFAADMPKRGIYPVVKNPRVEDVDKVIRKAYANFYARNKDATHDIGELGGVFGSGTP